MDGTILQKLGIDTSHLIAQLVNFTVVIVALVFFLFKPVVRMLDERKKKIAAGLEQAERAKQQMKAADEAARREMDKVRGEASELLIQMRQRQEKEQKRVIEEGRSMIRDEFAQAREEIKKEREQLFEDVKKKTAIISVDIARQILKKEISPAAHQKMISAAIKKL